ncbi:isoaspartyl peptidase/L-asparaginase family protein [Sphingomonas sp.]|uniref:isoaspartyl peptidase/L-asparaginase family protein n=1 Tax=Sphingomonas sp. TaxID=28214 RepID=UPI0035BC4BE4
MTEWTLTIHGGAGGITREVLTPEQDAAARAGLAAALVAGARVLAAGGAAVEAVAATVIVLEDDPAFNSGRGAVLTSEGRVALDAAIMGGDRRAGAVAGVTATRNPVALARAVMEDGAHVFLAGGGADAFSAAHGLEQAGEDWFVTAERRRQLAELQAKGADAFDVEMKYGTVGAVACDMHGHVAAATSTGGVTGKRWGRVGDSPVIGAGTWADDRACAVSCTGSGETFLRAGVAHAIAARVRHLGEDAGTAAQAVLSEVVALGGTGGIIVVTPAGDTAMRFSTRGMYRGTVSSGVAPYVAIYGDE